MVIVLLGVIIGHRADVATPSDVSCCLAREGQSYLKLIALRYAVVVVNRPYQERVRFYIS